MKNRILNMSAFLALSLVTLAGCRENESDLLEPKLYFESTENTIEVDNDAPKMAYDLQSRLSSKVSSNVEVTYSIADAAFVEEYNAKYGKEYLPFMTASFSSETTNIAAGEIYSDIVKLQLSGLDNIEVGNTYLLPVRVQTGDVPVIDGADIAYYVIKKPVRIIRAARFYNSFFKVPITPLNVFKEVTYEAIVNISSFGNNNTVMGCEGVMIMRIGDAGGGTVPENILQMAGKSEMTWSDNPLQTGIWYHLAFTCAADGVANLYVNGERVVQGSFTMSSDLTMGGADFGFSVGMVPRFMWGTRPFSGYMTEVRLWNVVRSANQIRENMLNVDPETPGLVAYYKLGEDLTDSSPNGLDPTDYSLPTFEDLKIPVAIGGGLTE